MCKTFVKTQKLQNSYEDGLWKTFCMEGCIMGEYAVFYENYAPEAFAKKVRIVGKSSFFLKDLC